jgi:outer membrane immunogenic protein
MRGVVVAFLGLGLVSSAQAADLDMLRGSRGFEMGAPSYQRWSGFYGGGQAGLGVGAADFAGASKNLTAYALRNTLLESEMGVSSWALLNHADTGNSLTYGGFAGYNFQFDEIVFGVEANYMRTDISAQSSGALGRRVTLSDGFAYDVTPSASAKITVADIGTLRWRIGYAFNRFLGYVTVGGALGYANYGTTAAVSYPAPTYVGGALPAPANPGAAAVSAFDGKNNALIHGFAVGGGLDMAVTQNLFVRGEYEYIQFTQYKLGINNVRGAVGLKF